MATSNGEITAPVSIRDVQVTLGDGSNDLGALCQSTRINRWARYKPVKLAKISTIDQLDSNNQWKNTATWWKATAGNCGISYNTFSSVANVKTAIDNQALVWNYDPPMGGASQPFRLTDFNQYIHKAIPPVWGLYAQTAILQAGYTMEVGIAAGVSGDENITFGDMPALADYYFTVAFYNSAGTSLLLLYSSPVKIGQMTTSTDLTFEIPYDAYNGIFSNGGTYHMYGFLSTYRYTGQTSAVSGTYIPLPYEDKAYGAPYIETTAKTSNVMVSLEASTISGIQGNRVVNWAAYVYHVTGGISGATIQLIYASTGAVVTTNGTPQTRTINVTNDIPSTNPHYKSDIGSSVQKMARSGATTAFIMPDTDVENYLVEFISTAISGRVSIAHDITT